MRILNNSFGTALYRPRKRKSIELSSTCGRNCEDAGRTSENKTAGVHGTRRAGGFAGCLSARASTVLSVVRPRRSALVGGGEGAARGVDLVERHTLHPPSHW